jgi:hypothetical protein
MLPFKKMCWFYSVIVISNFKLYDANVISIFFYIWYIIYVLIYFLFYWFIGQLDN